jgi:hypothetical protein
MQEIPLPFYLYNGDAKKNWQGGGRENGKEV